MKYYTALFVALVSMLFVAGCMQDQNDNPVYSPQPADLVQDPDFV